MPLKKWVSLCGQVPEFGPTQVPLLWPDLPIPVTGTCNTVIVEKFYSEKEWKNFLISKFLPEHTPLADVPLDAFDAIHGKNILYTPVAIHKTILNENNCVKVYLECTWNAKGLKTSHYGVGRTANEHWDWDWPALARARAQWLGNSIPAFVRHMESFAHQTVFVSCEELRCYGRMVQVSPRGASEVYMKGQPSVHTFGALYQVEEAAIEMATYRGEEAAAVAQILATPTPTPCPHPSLIIYNYITELPDAVDYRFHTLADLQELGEEGRKSVKHCRVVAVSHRAFDPHDSQVCTVAAWRKSHGIPTAWTDIVWKRIICIDTVPCKADKLKAFFRYCVGNEFSLSLDADDCKAHWSNLGLHHRVSQNCGKVASWEHVTLKLE